MDRHARPDLSFRLLEPHEQPADRWCVTGHRAGEGDRFLHVSGPMLDARLHGVYCEPCVAEANRRAAEKRKQKV